MAFQCSGTAYCLNSDSATVSLKFSDASAEILRFQNAPICIVLESLNAQNKCYTFAGKDVYDINSFEIFLCGTNPGYVTAPEGGVSPAFNGVIAVGSGSYRYKPGTQSITQVTKIVRSTTVYESAGDCSGCLIDAGTTKVTITDKDNNKVFEKTGLSPEIKASCDGCAPGEIKCKSDAYPGYCCIPCSEIKSGIVSLTALVRSKNNG